VQPSTIEPWFELPEPPPTPASPAKKKAPGDTGNNENPTPASNQPVDWLVIGAGLAGCTTARELADNGCRVTLVDKATSVASAASANQHALLRPHASRGESLSDNFFDDAYRQALLQLSRVAPQQLDNEDCYSLNGVLQLVRKTESYRESDHLRILSANDAGTACGLPMSQACLYFPQAGSVNTPRYCHTLAQHPRIDLRSLLCIDELTKQDNLWHVSDGATTISARTVILATGAEIGDFAQTAMLGIVKARGQTTLVNPTELQSPTLPICGGHYLVPFNTEPKDKGPTTLWQTGASFHRGNAESSILVQDEQDNLRACAALLLDACPEKTAHAKDQENRRLHSMMSVQDNWAGVRATTHDRLPVLGGVPDWHFFNHHYADLRHGRPAERYAPAQYLDGLYVNGGYGSRGLCVAALCAKLLVNHLLGRSSAVEHQQDYLRLLHPARFHIRELKKSAAPHP